MKDNQDLIAGRIARLLDEGRELPQPVLARLRQGRQSALNRQRNAETLFALPGGLQWGAEMPWLTRFVMPLIVVLALGLVSQQWVASRTEAQQQEVAEIDAAMLRSDLPLDAYLDRDFYAWLHTTPE